MALMALVWLLWLLMHSISSPYSYVPSDEEFDDEPRETVTDIPADDFEAREYGTCRDVC